MNEWLMKEPTENKQEAEGTRLNPLPENQWTTGQGSCCDLWGQWVRERAAAEKAGKDTLRQHDRKIHRTTLEINSDQ